MRYDHVISGVAAIGTATVLYFAVKPRMDLVDEHNRVMQEHSSFKAVTNLADALDTSSHSPIDYTLLTKGSVEDHDLVAIRNRCVDVQKVHTHIGDNNLPEYQSLLQQAITTCANIGSKVKDNQLTFAYVSQASTMLRESASSAYVKANSERMKKMEAERADELKKAKVTAAEMSNWNKEK